MREGLDRLLFLLDLERIDRDLFRGANPTEGHGRVFGGQVASQALRAAAYTVEADHRVNSLHAYFLRPGRPAMPIVYSVDRIRDGKSFTTRRVVAIQDGEAIFNLDASFHKAEAGGEFQQQCGLDWVPPPDEVRRDDHWGPHRQAIDFREVEPPRPPSTRIQWVKADGTLPDDPVVHACVLAYASDSGPVGAARRPLRDGEDEWERFMSASLDHTMWFHRPVRADEWLLYDLQAVACSNARGLARGTFWTREGLLAISVCQEALIRPVNR
ncbi:MAG TPA: acyl-CoA thioesterase II [Acidimicrobiales bacterium]|nr:acyl-CoA thioesterase II [Acidimicrobiales bacterium]